MGGLFASFRGFTKFSRAAKLFLLCLIVLGLAGNIAWMMLNFYLQSLKLDQAYIGLINAIPSLALVGLGYPLGRWSDTVGRRFALWLGAFITAGALAGIAVSESKILLATCAALSGIGQLLLGSNTPPFLMEHSAEEERTHLFSAQAALGTGTGLVGSILGGVLPALFAGKYGVDPSSVLPLRGTLIVAAAIGGLSLVPLLLLPRKMGKGIASPSTETGLLLPATVERVSEGPPGASNARLFVKLLIPHAMVGLGAGMTMPFMNLYIEGRFGVSYQALGTIFGVSSVVTALSMLIQPWLAGRYGKVRAVLITQACSIPFLLVLAYVPVFALAAVALFLRGALMNMAVPVYNAYCMEMVPPSSRATFAGLEMMTWSCGWAIGSYFSGHLRQAVGFTAGFNILFACMAGLYVTGIILFYLFFGRRRG